ncbi:MULTISPECIES: hypothetical protein [unclassified Rhizobium]|uniref:hypothetical protein n=1 Tax=unclassified Rhizobium TaxID=2613769 RepID=UPI0006FBF906|nr:MULTISPECIES: hypothetical protein [unclassified Rhizobium]KQV40539.1 hypothetical protein ASC86_21730 [Rhizobium sp. Root1212]KRD35584.1 hypothetical protein ASE37_21020 [Rhizobium sp. Root268]
MSGVQANVSTDIVTTLETAANTIHGVTLKERRRLIEQGIEAATNERAQLLVRGEIIPLEPAFMVDMPTLAETAGHSDTVAVIVSAGMLMLAAEIGRLRRLIVRG